LVLQAVVSNYLNVDLENVLVTLVKPKGFKQVLYLNENGTQFEDINGNLQLTIPFIKSQVGKSVSFALTPTKLGQLDLTIKAQSALAADAESRKILVKAEGIPQINNQPLFFQLSGIEKEQLQTSMQKLLPIDRVPDSEYCEIQVIGDLLGPAFNNLDNLLDKPTGCGEQNMLYLTPNIYALKYLSRKPMISAKPLIEKARRNIQTGYENELRYRRLDGSFSAFGQSDKNGSSWLTAFVVKSFTQAREFIDIDSKVLDEATDWLLKQQNNDGSFNEPGQVINKNMQGGSNNNNLTNTAYITISLLESNLSNPKLIKPIESAINYLESYLNNIEDPYILSMISYAFSLVNSFKSGLAYRKLNALAITSTPGYKYWSKNETDGGWMYRKPSSDIEMTSYALLSSLRENDVSKSIEIVRWLVNQTNSLGAYSSTQNTVLALQALTTFALKTATDRPTNAQAQILADEEKKVFNITEENLLVLQSWQIRKCPDVVDIQANGVGNVFLQLIASYNVPSVDEPPVFELNQTVENQYSINNLQLKTCVRYVGSDQKTGMSIVEAGVLSGFTVNKADLKSLVERNDVKDLKFAEFLDDNKVAFYFNELDSEPRCILWNIERAYPVASPKPVVVRAYDYYRPEMQVIILFNALSNLTVCNVSNEIENC
jgi:CD109 antigen